MTNITSFRIVGHLDLFSGIIDYLGIRCEALKPVSNGRMSQKMYNI